MREEQGECEPRNRGARDSQRVAIAPTRIARNPVAVHRTQSQCHSPGGQSPSWQSRSTETTHAITIQLNRDPRLTACGRRGFAVPAPANDVIVDSLVPLPLALANCGQRSGCGKTRLPEDEGGTMQPEMIDESPRILAEPSPGLIARTHRYQIAPFAHAELPFPPFALRVASDGNCSIDPVRKDAACCKLAGFAPPHQVGTCVGVDGDDCTNTPSHASSARRDSRR
jgi:hypothetical protein